MYTGRYRDAAGRVLEIRTDGAGFRVTILGPDGEPFPRSMLEPSFGARTRELEAAARGGALEVELGTPGLGPALRLRGADADTLLPEIVLGLYDDFEDDLGVPWIYPLSPYLRADH